MNSEWQNFFFAVICASGSLLGLQFVAISISLSKIIASKGLAKVAIQPLLLLLSILIISLYFLIPGQTNLALGIEVSISAILFAFVMVYNDVSTLKETGKKNRRASISNVFFNSTPMAMTIFAGIFIGFKGHKGIYIFVPAIIISFVQAMSISWAFLLGIHLDEGNRRGNFETAENTKDPQG